MRDALNGLNERLGGLPRRALLILATLAVCGLVYLLLPYVAPFALGFVLSMATSPLAHRLSRAGAKPRLPRALASLLLTLALFGAALFLIALLTTTLVREGMALIKAVPDFLTDALLPLVKRLYAEYRAYLPDQLLVLTQNALTSLGQSVGGLATRLSGAVASGAVATAAGLPATLLFAVLTVTATYTFTADRARIKAFLRRQIPSGWISYLRGLRLSLGKTLFGQLKSQLILSLILSAALAAALALYGVPYGLFAGLLIGLCDALPVVGAGLFLIPWGLFALLFGDTGLGAFLLCLYVGVVLLRQVLEPRIVGRHLGVYPLAAMMAMYAGFRLLGFIGLLIGPVLLSLLRAVLSADEGKLGFLSKKS